MKNYLPNREKVKENQLPFPSFSREVLVPLFRRLQEDLRTILFEPKVGVQCLASQPNSQHRAAKLLCLAFWGRMLNPLGMLGSKTLNMMMCQNLSKQPVRFPNGPLIPEKMIQESPCIT